MTTTFDYTVTTLDDFSDDSNSATWSLREAIEAANANGGAETIGFDAALNGTITLTEGQLDITESLSIDGGGVITVSGDVSSRVMRILTGSDDVYALNDITLRDGLGANGGGLYVGGGNDVTLTDVTIRGSLASSDGGGIYVSGTGASSKLTLTDSSILENVTQGRGGGLFAGLGADVTVNGTSAFDYNSAQVQGGSIFGMGATTSVVLDGNSVIVEDGRAYGATGAGGGIAMISGSSLEIRNGASVQGNTAAASISMTQALRSRKATYPTM